MPRQTKAEKLIDMRIDAAYRRTCSGIAIDMMAIPTVFRVGRVAIVNGATDDALDKAIIDYVATIRH